MRIKVLNLDGVPDSVGDIFSADTVVTFDKDGVPIKTAFFDPSIEATRGRAMLNREGDALYAYVSFYQEPLRGYPAVGGVLTEHEGPVMKKVAIKEIVISEKPNADKRIERIPEA